MNTLKQIFMQEANEERYSRKFIDGYISGDIRDNPDTQAKIQQGVELLEAYTTGSYYDSKMRRLAQLEGLDLETLVTDIYIGICYFQRAEMLSSVAAQMASRLKLSDRVEAVTTVAEILAILCLTDAFDIDKLSKSASLTVISRIRLTDKTLEFVRHSSYLPPMVCEPLELTSNYSSGYLTHNDSLILGQGNHHGGDICLDVLNLMNQVPLKINTEFLSSVEEEPTSELMTEPEFIEWQSMKNRHRIFSSYQEYVNRTEDQWLNFKTKSYNFYSLLVNQGNQFYFTHKVDKRGRIYAQGYHINTQGTPFKKASIELFNEELVTGVPT